MAIMFIMSHHIRQTTIAVMSICLSFFVLSAKAFAKHGAPQAVLEVFTSQGCPACPKANTFARKMADNPDILVLSYSVDYWDYFGWKDTFSKPEFAIRQHDYARQFKGRVYTPQMVVNGKTHKKTLGPEDIVRERLTPTDFVFDVRQNPDNRRITIHIANRSDFATPYIFVARYVPGVQTVPIKAGRNKGRTMGPVNIVTSCAQINLEKSADQSAAQNIGFANTYPLAANEALAVIVQKYKGGPILAAYDFHPSPQAP